MNLHIARGGQQLGVFAEADIQSGLATGRFFSDDLCWGEGMADWQPLSARFGAVSAAPPAVAPFNPYATPQAALVNPALVQNSRHALASRGARLGAALLDALVAMVVVGVPLIAGVILMSVAEQEAKRTGVEATPVAAIICFIIAGLAFLGITIYNIVLLSTRGQTIAKKWLRMRIVTYADGQNPGFVKAFLLRSFVNAIIGQVVPFYGIVDACLIFREDQRCVHDLIADTVVVMEPPAA